MILSPFLDIMCLYLQQKHLDATFCTFEMIVKKWGNWHPGNDYGAMWDRDPKLGHAAKSVPIFGPAVFHPAIILAGTPVALLSQCHLD